MTMANLRRVASVEGAAPITIEDLLDRAFSLTQNVDANWAAAPAPGVTPETFEGEGVRSTSVGDVAEIEGAWWLRAAVAWERIEQPGPALIDRTREASGKGFGIIGSKPTPGK
ncbi:MAG: hypothetical protein WA190_00190 [Usitatibacter sp.]